MMMKFQNNNQTGFSLTEVMIGGALLAGVSFGAVKIFDKQRSSQKNVDEDRKLQSFHQTLSHVLQNTANCNATFKFAYGSTITGSPTTSQKILRCVGAQCNKPGADAGSIIADQTPLFEKDMWIDQAKTWRIDGIYFLNSLSKSGTMQVRVTYVPGQTKGKVGSISKDIPLSLRFTERTDSTPAFKGCVNPQQASFNNFQNDLCRSLNPAQVEGPDTLAYWDPENQTCVVKTNIKNCPNPKEQIEGLRIDGTVNCAPIINELNYPDGSTNACQKTILEFNQNTKKMEVKCV